MRIIAMIMIITFHITRHRIRDQLVDKSLISLLDISDCFCHPKFYPQLMFLSLRRRENTEPIDGIWTKYDIKSLFVS